MLDLIIGGDISTMDRAELRRRRVEILFGERLVTIRLVWLAAVTFFAIWNASALARIAPSPHWWQGAVIYEIYPRSFQDSNGDGIGDLNGITNRLQYLQDLGVDAIWITPMFPSPLVDLGYDVSDYENIAPEYGTLAEFDRLLLQAHQHHIRLILDMVLNHTSDKHPWFVEASRSTSNKLHDWYVWSDGKSASNGTRIPPNHWKSFFGESSWQWVPSVRQFYYHAYYKEQPDLNWRNPAVEAAMFSAIRFWLDRGVDGFRLDSISDLFEDQRLRDEPLGKGVDVLGQPRINRTYTTNQPEIHSVIRRMRSMVSSYPGDRVLIGETDLPDIRELDKWYGGIHHDELQLPMDTPIAYVDKLDATKFRHLLTEVNTEVHGSEPLLYFDCHDTERSWDRYGDGVHNALIAKLIATLLLTSKATVLLYQGEELGQVTSNPTRLADVRDPVGRALWPKYVGRDGERTPMQWDRSNAQAGFSTNPKPWLPVSTNYATVNVRYELGEQDSLLTWHKTLIALRREYRALWDGSVIMLNADSTNVLSYARKSSDGQMVVVSLNMSASSQSVLLEKQRLGSEHNRVDTLLSSGAETKYSPASQRLLMSPFGSWVGVLHQTGPTPGITH